MDTQLSRNLDLVKSIHNNIYTFWDMFLQGIVSSLEIAFTFVIWMSICAISVNIFIIFHEQGCIIFHLTHVLLIFPVNQRNEIQWITDPRLMIEDLQPSIPHEHIRHGIHLTSKKYHEILVHTEVIHWIKEPEFIKFSHCKCEKQLLLPFIHGTKHIHSTEIKLIVKCFFIFLNSWWRFGGFVGKKWISRCSLAIDIWSVFRLIIKELIVILCISRVINRLLLLLTFIRRCISIT